MQRLSGLGRTYPHVLALLDGLLLVLNHALQPVHGRHAVEEPGQLGVRLDVALHEDRRLGRVDA